MRYRNPLALFLLLVIVRLQRRTLFDRLISGVGQVAAVVALLGLLVMDTSFARSHSLVYHCSNTLTGPAFFIYLGCFVFIGIRYLREQLMLGGFGPSGASTIRRLLFWTFVPALVVSVAAVVLILTFSYGH